MRLGLAMLSKCIVDWSPAALDTAAFVDLSVRRCRAWLAASWFGTGLFVCEMVFCLAWIYRYSRPQAALLSWLWFGSIPMDVVWVLTLVFFGFWFRFRRNKRAELGYLLELRGETSRTPRMRGTWRMRRGKRTRKSGEV
jgi:hypothetical protein